MNISFRDMMAVLVAVTMFGMPSHVLAEESADSQCWEGVTHSIFDVPVWRSEEENEACSLQLELKEQLDEAGPSTLDMLAIKEASADTGLRIRLLDEGVYPLTKSERTAFETCSGIKIFGTTYRSPGLVCADKRGVQVPLASIPVVTDAGKVRLLQTGEEKLAFLSGKLVRFANGEQVVGRAIFKTVYAPKPLHTFGVSYYEPAAMVKARLANACRAELAPYGSYAGYLPLEAAVQLCVASNLASSAARRE